MPSVPPAAEINALAKILDELDYYEVLGLGRAASQAEVKRAYHDVSRRFHPDAHRELAGGTRQGLLRVAKRVTEAYTVLRDPRRRRVYDERLEGTQAPIRLQLAEANAEAGRKATHEHMGRTPNGRRFFAMAQADLERRDLGAAARNLQMALTFEPANALFRQRLSEIRQQLGARRD